MLGVLNKEKQVIQFGKIKKNVNINTFFSNDNSIKEFEFSCDLDLYNKLEEGFVYVKYPYVIYKVPCKRIRQFHADVNTKENYNYYINDCLFMYNMITYGFYIGNAKGGIKLPFPIVNIYQDIDKLKLLDKSICFYKICIGQALKGINISNKKEVILNFPKIINLLLSAKSNSDLPWTGFLYNSKHISSDDIHKVFSGLTEIHKNLSLDEAKLWYQKNKDLNVVIEMLLNDKDWKDIKNN